MGSCCLSRSACLRERLAPQTCRRCRCGLGLPNTVQAVQKPLAKVFVVLPVPLPR